MAVVRLGDLCTKIGSGATPRGGKDVYRSSGVAFVRSQNVYNDGFNFDGIAYIGESAARALEGVLVESNDVLLNITGESVGRCCLAPENLPPARVSQHVLLIRPKPSRLHSPFLRYWLISPPTQALLAGLSAAGATRRALTKGMIENLSTDFPPLDEQRRIAAVLEVLDDKIELNRKMSRMVEQIAQAIFKSQFIDFDGALDTETVASDLGPIPRGWSIEPLDTIADFLNGAACQNYPSAEGEDWLPVIKIRELNQGVTDNTDKATSAIPKKWWVADGDVLFSWSGSLLVKVWTGGRGALNQHLFKVTSSRFPRWFYLLWTQFHLSRFQQIAADKATTMGHIKRLHLTEALCTVPPESVLRQFDAVLGALVERQVACDLEVRTLAGIRNALLPKLISREIRVPEGETIVEAR